MFSNETPLTITDNMASRNLNPQLKKATHYLLLPLYCASLFAAAELTLRHVYGNGRLNAIEHKASMDTGQCPLYPSGNSIEQEYEKSGDGKSEKHFRIFVFGESSVQGYPFTGKRNIPGWMSMYLNDLYPEKNIQVANCGLVGADSRIWGPLFLDSLKYNPDLMVIYAGHNNFVEPTVSPDLPHPSLVEKWIMELYTVRLFKIAVRNLFPPPTQRTNVESLIRKTSAAFKSHLKEMVEECRRRNIPVIISTVSSNRSGWFPGLTDLYNYCRKQPNVRDQVTLCRAKPYIDKGEYEHALEILRLSEKNQRSDWRDNLITYYKAVCLEKTGAFSEALDGYDNAIRNDFYRHRAPVEINDTIKFMEHKYGNLTIVDADAVLSENSKNGITGKEMFVDAMHPNTKAQSLIAMEIVKAIAKNKTITADTDWKRLGTDAEYEKLMGIPPNKTDIMELAFCFRLMQQKKFQLSLDCYEHLTPDRLRFMEEAPVPVLQLLLGNDNLAKRAFVSFVHARAAEKYSEPRIEQAFETLKKNIIEKDQFYDSAFPEELSTTPAPDFKSYMEHNTDLKFR